MLRHDLDADVGVAQELTVGLDLRQPRGKRLLEARLGLGRGALAQRQLGFQAGDPRVAFERLEAGVDQVDTVEQRVQLGRLVRAIA
jgi:hypothetical protein